MSGDCFVHESLVGEDSKSMVRMTVCKDLEANYHSDNKKYCVLHFPNKKKDTKTDFLEVIRSRINTNDLDFSYSYIPTASAFFGKIFNAPLVLNHAIFACRPTFINATYDHGLSFKNTLFEEDVDFSRVTFKNIVDFEGARFEGKVLFQETHFHGSGNFRATVYEGEAIFRSANFHSKLLLRDADFKKTADFMFTRFGNDVDFRATHFRNTADMRSTHFHERASFHSVVFSGHAYFIGAFFLGEASFTDATFEDYTKFDTARFGPVKPVHFNRCHFQKDTYFDKSSFDQRVVFDSAVFGPNSDIFFRKTKFLGEANFGYCRSEGYLRFSDLEQGPEHQFDFQEAAFEKTNRVSFHTVDLCPNWFVNVDAREIVFTDIFWKNLNWDFSNTNIQRELGSLEKRGIKDQKNRLFEITARQLAVNAEENNRYTEAAKFRYMAMETRRLEELGQMSISRVITWLYKWTSGYGESWGWATLILLTIWIMFGVAYWLFGSFGEGGTLNFWQSMGYSSLTMLFQKPELQPLSNLTFSLRILETILAPLQAALLALAIRRKFMR